MLTNDGETAEISEVLRDGLATPGLTQSVSRPNCNVALKTINMRTHSHELEILQHLQTSRLAQTNVNHPGRNSAIQLLDDFDLASSRKCLVFPAMGMDVQARIESESGGRLKKKNGDSHILSSRPRLRLSLEMWHCTWSYQVVTLWTECRTIDIFPNKLCSTYCRDTGILSCNQLVETRMVYCATVDPIYV